MDVGIFSRTDVKEAIDLTKKVLKVLKNYDVYLDSEILEHVSGREIENVDILITVGGDGTILRAEQKYNTPMLGVRLGRHGFLCEINPEEISSIPEILQNHRIEERTKLEVLGVGDALNDAVIHSTIPTKVSVFDVMYDDRRDRIVGDGLIISTPTGSTAYSFAAGGPVVYNADVFLVTSICSLDRKNISTVISASTKIHVEIVEKDCYLVLDGVEKKKMKPGDFIEVVKSEKTARFLRR